MFAAASNRAGVNDLLAKRGADLKATTNVVDLNGLDRQKMGDVLFGNPAPPPQPGGRANDGAQAQAQQGRNFPGGRGLQGKAGIERQFQLNELIYAQGGLNPIHLAARQGYTESVVALLDAGV